MKRFFIFTNIVLTSLAFLCTGCGKLTNETNTDPEPPNNIPADALPGVFSVSSTKKVHFSKGNLVATIDASGVPTAWKFAANQYDCLGEGGANKTIGSAAGDVDLFGWSTPKTNYGISTSTEVKDYSGNFVEWGTVIDNKGTWTTLSGGSSGEWKYLFENHVNVWGTCNSVPGRFIAPDDFKGDESDLSKAIKDWKTAQAAGIVFLPAEGSRASSSVDGVGYRGYYWSSSASEININNSCYIEFSSDIIYLDIRVARYNGFCVRLVTVVK